MADVENLYPIAVGSQVRSGAQLKRHLAKASRRGL